MAWPETKQEAPAAAAKPELSVAELYNKTIDAKGANKEDLLNFADRYEAEKQKVSMETRREIRNLSAVMLNNWMTIKWKGDVENLVKLMNLAYSDQNASSSDLDRLPGALRTEFSESLDEIMKTINKKTEEQKKMNEKKAKIDSDIATAQSEKKALVESSTWEWKDAQKKLDKINDLTSKVKDLTSDSDDLKKKIEKYESGFTVNVEKFGEKYNIKVDSVFNVKSNDDKAEIRKDAKKEEVKSEVKPEVKPAEPAKPTVPDTAPATGPAAAPVTPEMKGKIDGIREELKADSSATKMVEAFGKFLWMFWKKWAEFWNIIAEMFGLAGEAGKEAAKQSEKVSKALEKWNLTKDNADAAAELKATLWKEPQKWETDEIKKLNAELLKSQEIFAGTTMESLKNKFVSKKWEFSEKDWVVSVKYQENWVEKTEVAIDQESLKLIAKALKLVNADKTVNAAAVLKILNPEKKADAGNNWETGTTQPPAPEKKPGLADPRSEKFLKKNPNSVKKIRDSLAKTDKIKDGKAIDSIVEAAINNPTKENVMKLQSDVLWMEGKKVDWIFWKNTLKAVNGLLEIKTPVKPKGKGKK